MPSRNRSAWYSTTWCMLTVWLLVHLAMLGLWQLTDPGMNGDVVYYSVEMQSFPFVGVQQTLTEYPTPVVWLFELIWTLSLSRNYVFQIAFSACMALADLVFTLALWHGGGPRRVSATYYWIIFTLCMGPLVLFRFDMVPAVLAGLALLWAYRRPGIAGGLVGLGAAFKLWPALLIAPALAPTAGRKRAVTGFVGVGFGLAFLSLLGGGWERLTSPLAYQSDRGLQIESLLATPFVYLRTFANSGHTVRYSQYKAFEFFGPHVEDVVRASSALTVIGMLAIVLLVIRLYRMRALTHTGLGLVMVSIVAIMIITNKTLSPQYILWLAGPLAVLMSGTGAETDAPPGRLRQLGLSALVLALLTQCVYPIFYTDFVGLPTGTVMGAAALIARNSVLVLWTAAALILTWHATPRHLLDSPTTKDA